MEEIQYKKLVTNAYMPAKTTPGDAGYNIRAIERTVIRPYSMGKIRTGIAINVPDGFELQIRGKTNVAVEKGLAIAQGIGTIDKDYKDEVIVLLRNIEAFSKIVEAGEIIAQFILSEVPEAVWTEIDMIKEPPKRNPSTKKIEVPKNPVGGVDVVKSKK